MEKDVLELIRAFEKAAKKMENLDGTVSNFGSVISQLQEHLDELLEMVHLEEITTLSTESSQKLGHLKTSLEAVLRAKTQVFGRYVYQLTDTLNATDLLTGETEALDLAATQLLHTPIGTFALATDGLHLLTGKTTALMLEKSIADFAIYGNQLLYLSEGSLVRHHLLLKTEETIMENVLSMELLEPGHALRVTTISGESIVAI